MNLTSDCAALDCKGDAVLDFYPFKSVVYDGVDSLGEPGDSLRAEFGAPVSLCYPHYCQAVNLEKRRFQVLDMMEKQAAMSKKIYNTRNERKS